MPSIAITGSIGCGKSLATAILGNVLKARGVSVERFSADEFNRRILSEDPEARSAIIAVFGDDILNPSGIPDRKKLSRICLENPQARKNLESIVHPLIRVGWLESALQCMTSNERFFLAEIPLLFENNLDGSFNRSILLASSPVVRNKRLQRERGMDPSDAEHWIGTQLPQESKVELADHVIWNDGSESSLRRQLAGMADLLLAA